MTTVEAAGTTATAVIPTTEFPQPDLRYVEKATRASGINSAIVEAKSGAVAAARSAIVHGGKAYAIEQVVDAVVTLAVALIDVVITVMSLSKEKASPSGKQPAKPKPIPLLPNKKPAPAPKPSVPNEKAPGRRLEAVQDDKGVVTVRTSDGYVVRAEGTEAAWTIAAPDGKKTRIFGQPHVRENDGDSWQFKHRGTFVFGANKVTVETVPLSNGATVSSRITLYNGGERVTIGGIDKNKPNILALASDGRQHDDALSDGDIYSRAATTQGESWWLVQGGRKRVMGGR